MRVLSLVTLPASLPIALISGQYGQQAVLEELNASWRNSGSGVIFGNDTFSEKFQAFSSMLGEKIETVKNTVIKAVEAVCCPNKFQEITCEDDLYRVPACMYIPLLTAPDVRALYDAGRISGWGITPEQMPTEDVYGRLINNGRFDTGAPDYKRDSMVTFVYESGDPELTREQLNIIEESRAFISTFLEEQMGPGGDEMDITDMPNRMGKLRELKPVPDKS